MSMCILCMRDAASLWCLILMTREEIPCVSQCGG